jgi:putative ABC transport system permease protein
MRRDPSPARPPRLAEWLAGRAAPGAEWRDVLAGDMFEGFQAVATARGRAAACRWYWRETAAVVLDAVGGRARASLDALGRVRRPTGDSMIAAIAQDARIALRVLVHQPLVAGVVLVTLALGLGANIATYGMIDALILRPFTIPDVDRLIMISENAADDPYPKETIAPAHALAYAQPATTITGAASYGWWDVNLSGSNEPERVQGFRVSGDFFSVLRVTAARGRVLGPTDDVWGSHRQVVVSDGLWKRRFGGSEDIIGATIRLDGEPFEVVGVAPPNFNFPEGSEIWSPLAFTPASAADHATHSLTTFARLAPNVSIDAARAELEARFHTLKTAVPDANRGRRQVVRTFADGMIDVGMPQILYLWQAAALLVLLIGCTNIANLLLARGAARERELAVRLAIGAGRGRIVRQLLIEGAVLALVATPAALAVAALMFDVLRQAMPPTLVRFVPGWDQMQLSLGLTAYAIAASLVTAVLFGLVPALQVSRPNLTGALRDGGRSVTGGPSRSRLRRGLVVAEIALALPLLVASGLAAVGAHRFASGPQGYEPAGVLRARTILPETTYATPDSRLAFAERLVDAARQIPGVEMAATSSILPAAGGNSQRRLTIDGRPPDPDNPVSVDYRVVSPDYLPLLRVPIVQGRGITSADRDKSELVVVISQSVARRFWPGESPLGRRLRLGGDERPWLLIVGVAGDTIHDWFSSRREITAYVPVAQAPSLLVNLVVRTNGDPESLAAPIRRAVAAVDPNQPAFEVMTMSEALHIRTTGLRFVSGLMAAFGVLALVLATVGIYSVMAFYVAQRRYEMGIRLALGAASRDILRLTLGHGARMAALGIVIGLVAGVALARVMESALFGIVALEPWLFAAIAATLVVAALVASLLPALHATRVDPAIALRGI